MDGPFSTPSFSFFFRSRLCSMRSLLRTEAATSKITPNAMSNAGLMLFWLVLVALEWCTAKTITKPIVRLTSRPPSRKPISRRFGLGRKSITVTAASRVAFAAATSE